jgi:hypothetical protein
MKTGKNLFLVLVPHRDIRLELRKDLLKTGIKDAFLFPQVAPLAALRAPLTKDELKQTARAIKETVMANATDGKIFTRETMAVPFPADESKTVLFGPRVDPVFPRDLLVKTKSVEKKLTYSFLTQVIGCYLIDGTETNTTEETRLSFRAAAVANMYWKKAKDGWEWETGELIWLPKSLTKYKIM